VGGEEENQKVKQISFNKVHLNNCIFRAQEKAAAKEKKKNDRINGVTSANNRKDLKNKTMAGSKCKTSVVVDLSFDEKMDKRVTLQMPGT